MKNQFPTEAAKKRKREIIESNLKNLEYEVIDIYQELTQEQEKSINDFLYGIKPENRVYYKRKNK